MVNRSSLLLHYTLQRLILDAWQGSSVALLSISPLLLCLEKARIADASDSQLLARVPVQLVIRPENRSSELAGDKVSIMNNSLEACKAASWLDFAESGISCQVTS